MTDTIWQRNEDWVGSPIEDSFVMLHVESGTYVALNATARAIWETLATPHTQREVEDALMQRYTVTPEACAQSVTRTLQEMQAKQLAHAV